MNWIVAFKPDFTDTRIYVADNTTNLVLSGLTCLLNAYILGSMIHKHYDIDDTLQSQ